MVKKLIKHEVIYYSRTLGFTLPIIMVMGLMTRVFLAFAENDNVVTNTIAYSSVAMLAMGCMAAVILAVVISVVRFYKNMYTAEGYLSFTLPVTNHQHILVKLGAAVACQIVTLLAIVIAVAIASWEVVAGFNIFNVLTFEIFSAYVGEANAVLYIIEGVLLVLISFIFTTLLYYACITIGQTAKKNRILMAVATYFIYYVITQVIGTVFSIVFMILSMSGALDYPLMWLTERPTVLAHIFMCGFIVVYAALSVVFYVVTHRIMTKKLNLE